MNDLDIASKTAIVIPAYQPDDRLPPYVAALRDAGFARVVVVDDGSGEAYDALFNAIPQDGVAHVIRYTPNGGKGVALKRGLAFVRDECPNCDYIITADSDGQHRVADVERMAQSLGDDASGLLLGSRDFSRKNKSVPFKSRYGNRTTSIVFMLLYGHWVGDTQTGLRGFRRDLLPAMLDVRGNRYEYEMNALIAMARMKQPIRALPIDTVYENNNEGSHFRPLQDSLRIYGVIFGGFFRFISASVLCFLIDYGLYLLLNNLLKAVAPGLDREIRVLMFKWMPRIALATVLARIASGTTNFLINRKLVFGDDQSMRKSFPRYVAVCVLIVVLSAGLTSTLHLWLGWSDNMAKLPVDMLLFFLSYYLQRRWVFARRR